MLLQHKTVRQIPLTQPAPDQLRACTWPSFRTATAAGPLQEDCLARPAIAPALKPPAGSLKPRLAWAFTR